jgi:cyclohexadienyl dehydratase
LLWDFFLRIFPAMMENFYKTMTKLAILVLAAAFIVACGGTSAENEASQDADRQQGNLLDEILKRGVIRVGTTGDFNPISMKDPDTNEYVGFDIDLFNKLAADLDIEVEFVATDWRSLVSGVVAGKYDVTSNASYNMGRAKVANYTLPVIYYETVPLTLGENEGRFSSWESIDKPEITVATTLGTVFDEQAKEIFKNAKIINVEAPARDYQEVLSGRADVSITSNVEAATLVQTYPNMIKIDVDKSLYRRGGGLLVAKGEEDLLHLLDSWIRLQGDNGYLEELRIKWLGS